MLLTWRDITQCCGDSKQREIVFYLFFTTWILEVFLLIPLVRQKPRHYHWTGLWRKNML